MRFFPSSLRRVNSASLLIFALPLLLAGAIPLPNLAAQRAESALAAQPEPPLAPAVFQDPIPSAQLAFLSDYAGRPSVDVTRNKRFRKLMKQVIPRSEFHYGSDMPLSEASETLLNGPSLPVDIRDGRYVMVASQGGPYLSGRGFIWFDMQQGIALGGVYFHPVNGEPTPTLAVFSRQLKQDSLAMGQLPLAFAEDLSQWALIAKVPPITVRYFIPNDGRKYVLVHDEDFCSQAEDAPALVEDACQQMNADAADIDLEAATFMAQTHHAANATAWMLAPGQDMWIGLRDQTCAVGPDRLRCLIRITHQRTQALLRKH